MPATFSWRIAGLQCFPEYEGRDLVVTNIFWTVTATLDNKTSYATGNCVVRFDDSSEFVDYSNLSEQTVQNWISPEYRETVETQILEKLEANERPDIFPETVSPPLPWYLPQ